MPPKAVCLWPPCPPWPPQCPWPQRLAAVRERGQQDLGGSGRPMLWPSGEQALGVGGPGTGCGSPSPGTCRNSPGSSALPGSPPPPTCP
eukprot:4428685-Lingulodinium_polyedra.AAC.1